MACSQIVLEVVCHRSWARNDRKRPASGSSSSFVRTPSLFLSNHAFVVRTHHICLLSTSFSDKAASLAQNKVDLGSNLDPVQSA